VALKLSKYFITICFSALALVSIWLTFDKAETFSKPLITEEIQNLKQLPKDTLEQEVQKKNEPEIHSPKDTSNQKEEPKLESVVKEYLTEEEQLNKVVQAILNSDYKSASNLLKKQKASLSDSRDLDELIQELDNIKSDVVVNLFPGDSRYLKWVKSIISVNYVPNSNENDKKIELLEKLDRVKQLAVKQLKNNLKP